MRPDDQLYVEYHCARCGSEYLIIDGHLDPAERTPLQPAFWSCESCKQEALDNGDLPDYNTLLKAVMAIISPKTDNLHAAATRAFEAIQGYENLFELRGIDPETRCPACCHEKGKNAFTCLTCEQFAVGQTTPLQDKPE